MLFTNDCEDLLISKFTRELKSLLRLISFTMLKIIPTANANKIIKFIKILDRKASEELDKEELQ